MVNDKLMARGVLVIGLYLLMPTRLHLLIIASSLVILTLCAIQFYLVRNTYRLTRSQYQLEVRTALDAVRRTPTGQLFEKAANDTLQRYSNQKDSQAVLLQKLAGLSRTAGNWYQHIIRDSLHLRGVTYQAAFTMIVLEENGRSTMLLSPTQPPLNYIGSQQPTGEALLIYQQESRGGEVEQHRVKGNKLAASSFYISAVTRQQAYLAGTQQVVFRRMAVTLLLAVTLLIAVVTLFYLVFRALFRQKRLADIRTDLVNNISHELKTPLSSTAIILESLRTPEAQASAALRNELLAALQRQQNKLQRIVDSVLEDAVSGQAVPVPAAIPIAEQLRQYAAEYPAGQHQLEVAVKMEEVLLVTHMPSLEKVLNNLLDNAVKYTSPASPLRLAAYRTATAYIIRVQDKGPGIAARYQPHVFEKFFRVPQHDLHQVKGLGAGVSHQFTNYKGTRR